MHARTTARTAAAATAIAAAAGCVHAQAQWVDPSGGGWFDPNNWSTLDVPDTAGESAFLGLGVAYTVGIGSASFQVGLINIVNGNATLNLAGADIVLADSPGLINSGVVDADGDITGDIQNDAGGVFRIDRDQTLDLFGPDLVNNGQFVFGQGGGGSFARLDFEADVSVTGAGSFVEASAGEIRTSAASTVTLGQGISVTDLSFEANFINEGDISAVADSVAFTAPPGAASGLFENRADISASGGFNISVSAGTLSGGGQVSAIDDSAITLGNGLIIDGQTISTSDQARAFILDATIRDLVSNADLTNASSLNTAIVAPGMTNNGMFTLNTPGGSTARLNVNESCEIAGAGELFLDNGELLGPGIGVSLRSGVAHTIRGKGDIEGLTLINEGTVSAEGGGALEFRGPVVLDNRSAVRAGTGDLSFINAGITQTGAAELFADNAMIRFFGQNSCQGGTWRSDEVGSFLIASNARATVSGLTIDGRVHINDAGALAAAGTLTNNGIIVINSNRGSGEAAIEVDGPLTIGGAGLVVLNDDNDSAITNPGDDQLTIGADQIVAGGGRIEGPYLSRGTLAPGITNGDETKLIAFEHGLTLDGQNTLEIEAEGFSAFQRDRLTVAGPTTLAGRLRVSLLQGFEPSLGDRVEFLTATQPIVGVFGEVDLPALADPAAALRVGYNTTSVELVATCPADADADGSVGLNDLLTVLSGFGAGTQAGASAGDLDADGTVGLDDLLAVLAAFGDACT